MSKFTYANWDEFKKGAILHSINVKELLELDLSNFDNKTHWIARNDKGELYFKPKSERSRGEHDDYNERDEKQ